MLYFLGLLLLGSPFKGDAVIRRPEGRLSLIGKLAPGFDAQAPTVEYTWPGGSAIPIPAPLLALPGLADPSQSHPGRAPSAFKGRGTYLTPRHKGDHAV